MGWVNFFKVRVSIRTCVPNLGAVRRERFGRCPTVATHIPQTAYTYKPTNKHPTSHIPHPTNIGNPLNPLGWGGSIFFGESQSRLYPHMRATFGRGQTAVSKKGSLKCISRWRAECQTVPLKPFDDNIVGHIRNNNYCKVYSGVELRAPG